MSPILVSDFCRTGCPLTAELWGYRRHNSNPCKNTKRYRVQAKERFLTAEEMGRLNAVLTRDEFWCPHIVAIVRLLMLTGCRRGEIVSLEWERIKGKRILLPDSKSGLRTVWLSSAARTVIDAIPRYSNDCPYLFPVRPASQPFFLSRGSRAFIYACIRASDLRRRRSGSRSPRAGMFRRRERFRSSRRLVPAYVGSIPRDRRIRLQAFGRGRTGLSWRYHSHTRTLCEMTVNPAVLESRSVAAGFRCTIRHAQKHDRNICPENMIKIFAFCHKL